MKAAFLSFTRSFCGKCPLLALFVLGPGYAAVAADSWALQFNGSDQYVEVPLGETIVMDDQGPQFVAAPAGAWTTTTAGNLVGSNALQSSNPGASARWAPLLPRAGTYKVYAWWDGAASALDSSAQYVVRSADRLSTNVVNQKVNGGQWNLLGTFEFQANREEFVTLRPSGVGIAVADAVRFMNEQAFDLTQSLTLEAWVQVGAGKETVSYVPIVTKGDAWGLTCFKDYFGFRTCDASGAIHDLASAQRYATNRWYHLAAAFDGVRKTLYVDGTVAASALWQSGMATNGYPVRLGASAQPFSTNYFRGALDNVRVWSAVRSQSDLQACTNRNLRGTESGLVGEWRFDDNARTNHVTLDSAAGALHAWLRPDDSLPAQVAGVVMGAPLPGALALRFNGHDQCVVLPTPAGRFDLADAGTIETWIYFDFAPEQCVGLVSKGGSDGWELTLEPNGKILFRTEGILGTDPANPVSYVPAPDLYSSSRLDAGAWYHVAAVWDASTGRKDIYLNGVLDSSATGLQGEMTASTNAVCFAVRPGDAGLQGYFGGLLDEVRLWSIARSGAKIAENFGRDLNGTEPGLAGFWKFDEGSGLIAADKSPYTVKAHGTLSAGMTDLNRVAGRVLSPALLLQYSLQFDGETEYAQIDPANPFNLTDLTMEAWIKPALGRASVAPILRKGDNGYGLAIDQDGYLRFCSSNAVQQWPRSSRSLELERDTQGNPILDAQNHPVSAWNHVAVVVSQASNTTSFYMNGQPAGTHASSLVVNNTGPILLGRDGVSGGSYFQGLMDEVRLWNVPRSGVQVDLFAFTPLLGTMPPGLIGYWTFNEGTGTTLTDGSGAGHDGILVNIDLENWQDGTDWGLPGLPAGVGGLNPNPAAAGLWLGEVILNQVNEVQAAAQGAADLLTEAPHPASIRILLHVAGDGQVRLLKDVILMKKPSDTNAPPNVSTNPLPPVDLSAPATNLVLVTRPELIPDYQGVMKRGGKLVGLRYGTAAYDFEGLSLPLLGGVGPGTTCMGRINLSKDHPTNPYRHKYHPDHRSGFEIVRQLTVQFDGVVGDPWEHELGYGLDRLTGIYRETVVGLHKIPLRVEGTIRLDRINSVNVLDDGR